MYRCQVVEGSCISTEELPCLIDRVQTWPAAARRRPRLCERIESSANGPLPVFKKPLRKESEEKVSYAVAAGDGPPKLLVWQLL